MSYEHGTTHYNLPLTEGSDKRDWFDTNQAFEDIDAALFAAAESAESSASAVEALSDNVSDLQTRMNTAEADIDNVEAAQATADEQIIALSNRVNTIGTRVEGKFNSVAVQDAYSPNLTYSVGDYVTYDGNLYVCKTAITTGEPFDADKWDAVDLMTLIGAEIDDSVVSATKVWSSQKVNSELQPSAGDVRFNSGKLQQYDGTGWVDISMGGGSMPFLNYANPLATIDSNTSYTAANDCYITGVIGNAGSSVGAAKLTIDGTDVASVTNTGGGADSQYEYIAPLAIKAGSVISVTGSASVLHALSEVTN